MDPITPLIVGMFDKARASPPAKFNALHPTFMKVLTLLAVPASNAAFLANNGVERILVYLESVPTSILVTRMFIALLFATMPAKTASGDAVDIFPTVDLQVRCLHVVVATMDAFTANVGIILPAVSIAASLMKHHANETMLCADEDAMGVMLKVFKWYSEESEHVKGVRDIVRLSMLLTCWMIQEMDRRDIRSDIIPLLTRVTAKYVRLSYAAVVFLRCTIGVAKRCGTETGMQQFVDAGGVVLLLTATRMHPSEADTFSVLTRDVMVSEVGRKELLARRGMDVIMATIARADNELHMRYALLPLMHYPGFLPSSDVMEAMTKAGGVAMFKTILKTYPNSEVLSLTACIFLSAFKIPEAEHKECVALIQKLHEMHGCCGTESPR